MSQQWKGAKKAVYDSLAKVEGIRKPRNQGDRDSKLVNMGVLENHLINKTGDRDFITFFANHPHLQKVSRVFTFPIGQSPPVAAEISPSRSSPGDLGGFFSGANQQQLPGMTPIPSSPGAQPPASDGIPFLLEQDMKGQEGMLSF